MKMSLIAAVCCSLLLNTAGAADVARLSIEVTAKGDLTVITEPVADEDFAAADGKPVEIFGVPGADTINDDGFVVFSHKFLDDSDAESLGTDLRVEEGVLVADTSAGKDNIGPRTVLRHPRRFGFPFSIEMDVLRHGSIAKKEVSQGGRSLNFNVAVGTDAENASHLFVSFQASDTRYSNGLIYVAWRKPGEADLKEIGQVPIRDGKSRIRRKLPGFPESARLNWWVIARGDNAHIRRMRCAGQLASDFGLTLAGSAGQVTVKSVAATGPAVKAGLKEGDRIVSIDGERVRDVPTAFELLGKTPLFGSVKVSIRRGDKSQDVVLEGR